MKKKVSVSEQTYLHLVDCEEQLRLSREHFEAFSTQQWSKHGDLLRRLQHAEKMKPEFDKLMMTAKAFAAHKERDAETIATLTALLKEGVKSFNGVKAQLERALEALAKAQANLPSRANAL